VAFLRRKDIAGKKTGGGLKFAMRKEIDAFLTAALKRVKS
jgi:hypothetical protein